VEVSVLAYMFVILLPVGLKSTGIYLRRQIEQYSFMPVENIRTPDQLHMKIFALFHTMESGSRPPNIDGNHTIDELLYSTLAKADTKDQHNTLAQFQKHINEIYIKAIPNIKNNTEVKISYANYLLTNMNKFEPSAISLLHSCKSRHRTLYDKITAEMLLRKFEEILEFQSRLNPNRIDVGQFYTFYFLQEKLRNLIKFSIQQYISFWDGHQRGEKMVHLLDIHSKINKNAVKINKLWKKIESSSGDLIWSESVIYAIYLQTIRNCPATARKILEEYTRFLITVKEKKLESQSLSKTMHSLRGLVYSSPWKKRILGQLQLFLEKPNNWVILRRS